MLSSYEYLARTRALFILGMPTDNNHAQIRAGEQRRPSQFDEDCTGVLCPRYRSLGGMRVYVRSFVRSFVHSFVFFAVYLLGIFQIVIFQVQNLRLTPSAAHFICSTSFSFSHIHFFFGCVCRPQTLFSCLFLRTFMC